MTNDCPRESCIVDSPSDLPTDAEVVLQVIGSIGIKILSPSLGNSGFQGEEVEIATL